MQGWGVGGWRGRNRGKTSPRADGNGPRGQAPGRQRCVNWRWRLSPAVDHDCRRRLGRQREPLDRLRRFLAEQCGDRQQKTDEHPEDDPGDGKSEEQKSELQSLMRKSYAVFCMKKKN